MGKLRVSSLSPAAAWLIDKVAVILKETTFGTCRFVESGSRRMEVQMFAKKGLQPGSGRRRLHCVSCQFGRFGYERTRALIV